MKLESMSLENFRQFKGKQELHFSTRRDRNVTVVHAENGFGKTTLLKALLWGLYGQSGLMGADGKEEDFERPDHIIHEGTALEGGDPGSIIASVFLSFSHDGKRYSLRRSISLAQQLDDPKQTSVTLHVVESGQTHKLDGAQQRINALIPPGIAPFLFFNGERINYLAMERNSEQVTDAIQQVLGLRLLKTTIDDLQHTNVRGKLRAELRASTSQEKKDLLEEQSTLEKRKEVAEESIRECDANIEANREVIASLINRLERNRESAELQDERSRCEQERDEHQTARDDLSRWLTRLIAEDGYTLFSEALVVKGRELVNRLRSEGKIPARVLNSFLKDLLVASRCICTRCLDPGTPERKAVEELLTIAGDQDFNNAVGALDNALGLIEGVRTRVAEQLTSINRERLDHIRNIREIDERLEEIHHELGERDDEEVKSLEDALNRARIRAVQLDHDLSVLKKDVADIVEALEQLKIKIRTIAEKEEAALRAQRRVDAVDESVVLLTKILDAETTDLRPLLNEEIAGHFKAIMTKDYWAELSDNYTLKIRKNVTASGSASNRTATVDVALSTGERTVTSLVFIASLVALAERRAQIPTILRDLSGSEYPIAIDSPFGSLSVFREGVARHVPELAPQVLLFVSPEQYNGQVERALAESKRVGKRYFLQYHGPAIPERAAPELAVNGERYQQYVATPNSEHTEIVEI